jgi:hypothetical protein
VLKDVKIIIIIIIIIILKSVNRHCCVANTHALDHKTLNAHAQIRKSDLNPVLDKPGVLDKKKIMKCHEAKYHNYLSNTILSRFTILCINCLQESGVGKGGVC